MYPASKSGHWRNCAQSWRIIRHLSGEHLTLNRTGSMEPCYSSIPGAAFVDLVLIATIGGQFIFNLLLKNVSVASSTMASQEEHKFLSFSSWRNESQRSISL